MTEAGSGVPAAATAREAVAVFHDWASLQACVDDLLSSGFDRSELSLLAAQKAVEQKLGHVYEKVAELEDDPEVPRTAFVGRDSHIEARTGVIGALAYVGAAAAIGVVVASGGTIAAAIAAAAVAGGSGGLLGTVATRWLGRDRAKEIQSQIDRGGLLLWVRARDRAHEERAVAVLDRHSADDVHVHDVPCSDEPEADPLSGFQPDPFLPRAKV
jgi:outer membrane lipoprotein SlyB